MKTRQIDVLFIEPNSSTESYQALAQRYSAIETPTWSLLLANSMRSFGFLPAIIDANAERFSPAQVAGVVKYINPKLVVFVVYGQNPNSGTVNMSGAIEEAAVLREHYPEFKICFVGSHASALPKEVLGFSCVDFVLLNEGVYALRNLLQSKMTGNLSSVEGIGWKDGDTLILNKPAPLVPQERMDIDLPGYAWDLLPYRNKPFDLYRAHFWHTGYTTSVRQPFAAIYTSFGCKFGCEFCMINILNRTDNREDAVSSDFRVMRWWSSDFILKEFEKLAEYGVPNIRLSDEMFFLNKPHYQPIVEGLIQRKLGLNMWAYSRVDTCRKEWLDRFKQAGINWLALGIEAGEQNIRQEITKGSFKDVNIREVVREIKDSDINIVGNYIFGFPSEKMSDLKSTLGLALELNTEQFNLYTAMALPGSPLYRKAFPETKGTLYENYGFLSYKCKPLPTKYLSSEEVLRFRDEAWHIYNSSPAYLDLIEKKFGRESRDNIVELSSIRLKRQILGD